MAKFFGKVGYVIPTETAPGVWVEKAHERSYRGDIVRNNYRWDNAETLNDNFTISNTISIVADTFAFDNLPAIKYVEWMGHPWKVTSVEIQRPRLNLTIGGVYNGPRPRNSESCEAPQDFGGCAGML